jgi:hypothetical protein
MFRSLLSFRLCERAPCSQLERHLPTPVPKPVLEGKCLTVNCFFLNGRSDFFLDTARFLSKDIYDNVENSMSVNVRRVNILQEYFGCC